MLSLLTSVSSIVVMLVIVFTVTGRIVVVVVVVVVYAFTFDPLTISPDYILFYYFFMLYNTIEHIEDIT